MKKNELFLAIFLYVFSPLVAQTVNNIEQLTKEYLNLRFMCEPCIRSSVPVYENIGFKGSGIIGNVGFEDGRFVSSFKRSSNQSNGWYDFRVTEHRTIVTYSDTLAIISCDWLTYGALLPNGSPAKTFDRKEQEFKKGTDSYVLFVIKNGKANCCSFEIEYVNDSTIIEKHSDTYSRIFTISPQHIKISTPFEDDMWNIEIWLKNGNAIRVKDFRGDRCYQYTEFDSNGNWIKRKQINKEGFIILEETRNINYNN